MTATTTTPSIFRMFYTHKRTQMLLEAKGIKVMRIEKVSINKPSGKFYCAVQVVYTTAAGRCSTFISCKEYLARATAKRKRLPTTKLSKITATLLTGAYTRRATQLRVRHHYKLSQAQVTSTEMYTQPRKQYSVTARISRINTHT